MRLPDVIAEMSESEAKDALAEIRAQFVEPGGKKRDYIHSGSDFMDDLFEILERHKLGGTGDRPYVCCI